MMLSLRRGFGCSGMAGAASVMVLALAMGGCSFSVDPESASKVEGPRVGVSGDPRVCRLVELPLGLMQQADLSFEDLVTQEALDRKGRAASALVALAVADDRKESGRFRPALSFIAEREVAREAREAGEAAPPPRLPREATALAAALDSALALGLCG